jgi:glycosyltransferase involved in cell wall biosynthesis
MTEGKRHPRNLAVVCNTTRCGGIYRAVSTLCNAWSHQGRQVYLIALYDYESFFHLEASVRRIDALTAQATGGVARIRRKGENLLGRSLAGLKHFCPQRLADHLTVNAGFLRLSPRVRPLRAAIQHTDASVVIAFGWQANVLTLLACRNLGRKVIISERDDVASRPLQQPWEELRCGLYNCADVVTANTNAALRAMQSYVGRDKLVFVPNPSVRSDSRLSTPELPPFTPPIILIVANLTWRKAHEVLLAAFARLSPELSHWRLAIVGGGEEEKTLREHATELGVAERVDWYGRVADPFVFYRAAGMFVLPSRSEGMPNALIEAMSYGVPVIVSNASPGPLDLVKDGETGLVVPVDDPLALANAITSLGNDGALRKRLGEAGHQRVAEYNLANIMSLWDRIIATGPTTNQERC